jgi:phage repressor protein C with HTH and peptisase S24 domain
MVPASSDWGDPLESDEFIPIDGKYVKSNRFAARVIGDSCWPALRPGDLTIWEADQNPPYGVIVLAQRKGDHGCTVKELTYSSSERRPVLLPVNPDYESPEDGDGWGVIARLVVVIREDDGPEKIWYYAPGLRRRHLMPE